MTTIVGMNSLTPIGSSFTEPLVRRGSMERKPKKLCKKRSSLFQRSCQASVTIPPRERSKVGLRRPPVGEYTIKSESGFGKTGLLSLGLQQLKMRALLTRLKVPQSQLIGTRSGTVMH